MNNIKEKLRKLWNLMKEYMTTKTIILTIFGLLFSIVLSIFFGIGYFLLMVCIIVFFVFAKQSDDEKEGMNEFLGIKEEEEEVEEEETKDERDGKSKQKNKFFNEIGTKRKEKQNQIIELQEEIEIIEEHLSLYPQDIEAKMMLHKKKNELKKIVK